MASVTCRLTAEDRDQLWNPMLYLTLPTKEFTQVRRTSCVKEVKGNANLQEINRVIFADSKLNISRIPKMLLQLRIHRNTLSNKTRSNCMYTLSLV